MSISHKLISVLLTPFLLATTSLVGCASGGYKFTRQFAGFVNRQPVLIRVILYLLLGIVFAVTLLLDTVIFNTMDFWEGRVSDGSYLFKDGGRVHAVHHFHSGEERKLRNTRIEIFREDGVTLEKTLLLSENTRGQIQLFEDQRLAGEVTNLNDLPMITRYNANGTVAQRFPVLGSETVAAH